MSDLNSSSASSLHSYAFDGLDVPTSTPMASDIEETSDDESEISIKLRRVKMMPDKATFRAIEESESSPKKASNPFNQNLKNPFTNLAESEDYQTIFETSAENLDILTENEQESYDTSHSISYDNLQQDLESDGSDVDETLKRNSSIQIEEVEDSIKTKTYHEIDVAALETLDNETTFLEDYLSCLVVNDMVFLPQVNRDPNFELTRKEIPIDTTITIYISEVFSPGHFWFQCGRDVEEMMDELMKTYSTLSESELALSDSNIKVGLLVACYLPQYKAWNRAKVLKPLDANHMVRLLFVDFGTVGQVHIKHTKYLLPEFLTYPRFSHKGRLLNIKPPNGELAFCERRVNIFLMKIVNKPLSAKVVKMYPNEQDVFELDVTLGHRPNEQNLCQYLIESCNAERFELKSKSTYPMCYFFPTFAMLEKNYPTFHEKSMMSAEGIDFDLLLELDCLSCISVDTLHRTPMLLSMLGLEKFKKVKEYYFPCNK